MWRYLKEAFWARVNVPQVGALPVNALLVAGTGILGLAEHPFWLLGVGLETAYLFALATHPRFQRVVNARDQARRGAQDERAHEEALRGLGPAARSRLDQLEAKVKRVEELYRLHHAQGDQLLFDGSVDALRRLAGLYARLLAAEDQLAAAQGQADLTGLRRQRDALQAEVDAPALSDGLRESKRATLALVEKRLARAEQRGAIRAEVSSDLARVEAQVDLALEEAGVPGNAQSVGESLNLCNRILESNRSLPEFEREG